MRNVHRIHAALLLLAAAVLFLPAPAEAGRNCGGLNQKSCWHVDPTKWCDGDLKYKATGIPGQGTCVKREARKPKPACGGLNQSSCWNVNPAKWCHGELQYKPTGVPGQGTCVRREKDHCGNLGQQSCWHVNPARWCNDDLKYKPTGVPGQGTCVLRVSDEDLVEVADSVVLQMKTVGDDNPLIDLQRCLARPENRSALVSALGSKSGNGVNGLLRRCNASPEALRAYGERVLGPFNSAAANGASTAARHVRTRSGGSSADDRAWHLTIGALGGGVAKVGAEAGVGYKLALQHDPEARFFLFGGVSIGVGLEGGADVTVGIGYESMPRDHWARDVGVSVGYSGKALYGGGAAVDFSKDSVVPSGVTLSGGAGAGARIGVVTTTGLLYLYNF